jgi:branched-chain amino acid transport system permease protein
MSSVARPAQEPEQEDPAVTVNPAGERAIAAKSNPAPAPRRGRVRQATLGAARQNGSIATILVVVGLFGVLTPRQDYLLEGATAMTFAVAATGLGLALGLGGEYLLGQIAIFAVSAYVTADLTANHQWNFWPAAVAGIAAATVCGLLISIVGLRISRFYFALIGFFMVYLIPDLTQVFTSETGGGAGLSVPDLPRLLGYTLSNRGMYFLGLAALLLTLVIVQHVRLSPLGTHMRWMRVAPLALATAGVKVWRTRLATYVLAAALAGLGGAVYSHLSGYLLPDDFSLDATVLLFAAVIVGGSTSLLGPTIGIFVLYVIPRVVINISGYSDLIYGAVVLFCVIAFRSGIDDFARDLGQRVLARLRDYRAARGPQPSRGSGSHPSRQPGCAVARSPSGAVSVSELADLLAALRTAEASTDGRLVIVGARKSFGTATALAMSPAEAINVEPGQIHVLMGPNGSGKTTVLNAISGMVRLDAGTIQLGTHNLTSLPAARIARAGLSRSFQSPQFPDECSPVSLLAAALPQTRQLSYLHWMTSDLKAVRARRDATDLARRIASSAGLADVMDRPCTGLTSGQRRLLDVLLALVTRAPIALLDEPAAGLSRSERRHLGDLIGALAKRGMGFLLVEHDLDFALGVADQVTVLATGRILAHGDPAQIRADPKVRSALVGGSNG